MKDTYVVYPKYLVRPHDYTIFTLRSKRNGQYSIDRNGSNRYSYDVLISHDFFPCTENELPLMNERHELYLDYMMWHTRSDGHGGSKGGTMEEYLDYKEKVKIFKK